MVKQYSFLWIGLMILFLLPMMISFPGFAAEVEEKEAELMLNGDSMQLIIQEPFTGQIIIQGHGVRLESETVIDGDMDIFGQDILLVLDDLITGSMHVHEEAGAAVDILHTVGGDVLLQGSTQYHDLERIGGDLYIDAEGCVLNALIHVEGDVILKQWASLASLETVGGDLIVRAMDFDLSALRHVEGNVILEQCASLASLETVGGELIVKAENCDLPSLEYVEGNVTIRETLSAENIASLGTIDGDLLIDAPDMVFSDLLVKGTLALTDRADNLAIHGGEIGLVTAHAGPEVSGVIFKDVTFHSLYPRLTMKEGSSLLGYEEEKTFTIDAGEHWTFTRVVWPVDEEGKTLDFDIVVEAETVSLQETPVPGTLRVIGENFSMEKVTHLASDLIIEAPSSFAHLEVIDGDLDVGIEHCQLPQLRELGGSLSLQKEVGLPALETVGGDLEVLVLNDLPSLRHVQGNMSIRETLPSEKRNSLGTIDGDLLIDAPDMLFRDLHVEGTLALTERAENLAMHGGEIGLITAHAAAEVSGVEFRDVIFHNLYPRLTAEEGSPLLGHDEENTFTIDAGKNWTFHDVRWPADEEGNTLLFDIVVASEAVTFVNTDVPGHLLVQAGHFTMKGDGKAVEVLGTLRFAQGVETARFTQVLFQDSLNLEGSVVGSQAPYFESCVLFKSVKHIPAGTTFDQVRFSLCEESLPVEVMDDTVVFHGCTFDETTVLDMHCTDPGSTLQLTDTTPGLFAGQSTLQLHGEDQCQIILEETVFADSSSLQVKMGERGRTTLQGVHSHGDTSFHFQGRGVYRVYDTVLHGSLVLDDEYLHFETQDSQFLGDIFLQAGKAIFGQVMANGDPGILIGGNLHIQSSEEICFFNTIMESPEIIIGHGVKDVRFNSMVFDGDAETVISVSQGEGSPLLILNSVSFLKPVLVDGANMGDGEDLGLWLRGTVEGNDYLTLRSIYTHNSELGPYSVTDGVAFDFDLQGIGALEGAGITGSRMKGDQHIDSVIAFEESTFLGAVQVLEGSSFQDVMFTQDLLLEDSGAVFNDITIRADSQTRLELNAHSRFSGATFVEEGIGTITLIIHEGRELALQGDMNWEEAENVRFILKKNATINNDATFTGPKGEDHLPHVLFHEEEEYYILNITVEGEGHIELGESSIHREGNMVNISPSVQDPWEFYAWLGEDATDILEEEGQYMIRMDGDKEITAFFAKTYKELTIEEVFYMGAQGEVIDVTGTPPYPPGFKVQLKALPATEEDAFLYWSTTAGDPRDYFDDYESAETFYTVPGEDSIVKPHFTSRTKPVEEGTFNFDHRNFGEVISGQDGVTEHYWDVSALEQGDELIFYFNAQNIPDRFIVYYGDWGALAKVFASGWVSQIPDHFQGRSEYPEGILAHDWHEDVRLSRQLTFRDNPGGKLEGIIHFMEGRDVLKVEVEGRDEGTWWDYMLDTP